MAYIAGDDRNQPLLLPESIDQYVGPEHPVRVIDAFVDTLDLGGLGFTKSTPAATGRPPYHPGVLLKLYLWGYLNRVTSSRRLECECGRNLELLWLLGRLRPDFKTIADFRRENAEALPRVFREFSLLARELGLYGREVVAIDGTKLKASNHPARQASAERIEGLIAGLDARITEYLAALEQSERDLLGEEVLPAAVPGLPAKLAEVRRRKEQLQRSLEQAQQRGGKAPLTDPDCQSLQKVGLGYNAQVAVDAKHHLIAVAEIVSEATDHHQLPVIGAAAQQVLDAPELEAVADAGYHDLLALAQAEAAGLICYVPQPARGVRSGEIFGKRDFVYEAEKDGYRCPAGVLLRPVGQPHRNHGLLYQRYQNVAACSACHLRADCTKSQHGGRAIERWEHEAVIETVAERVATRPDRRRLRQALVEHPFGTIKFWRGQGALLTRGRRQVQAELSLSALAYNLTRTLQVMGTSELLRRLQARATRGAMARRRARFGTPPKPTRTERRLHARWRRNRPSRVFLPSPTPSRPTASKTADCATRFHTVSESGNEGNKMQQRTQEGNAALVLLTLLHSGNGIGTSGCLALKSLSHLPRQSQNTFLPTVPTFTPIPK